MLPGGVAGSLRPDGPLIFKSMPIKIEIVELVDDVLEPTKAAEPRARAG